MAHPRMNVTLTATDNGFLSPRLPLRGEIELFELGRDGSLVNAVFRVLHDDGSLGLPVEIANPVFTYDPVVDREMFRQRGARGATT